MSRNREKHVSQSKYSIIHDTWLRKIPEAERTLDQCILAVCDTPWNLQFVPEPLMTPEVAYFAVRKSNEVSCFVPAYMRTAIRAEKKALTVIHSQEDVQALRIRCIKADARTIYNIPSVDQSPDFLLEAVAANFRVLRFLPRRVLLQEGSEELREFLKENWSKVTAVMVPSYAAELEESLHAFARNEECDRPSI